MVSRSALRVVRTSMLGAGASIVRRFLHGAGRGTLWAQGSGTGLTANGLCCDEEESTAGLRGHDSLQLHCNAQGRNLSCTGSQGSSPCSLPAVWPLWQDGSPEVHGPSGPERLVRGLRCSSDVRGSFR